MSVRPAGVSRLQQQQELRERCMHPAGVFTPFPETAVEQSIPARFEQQAAEYPFRLAVKTRDEAFTYDQLNRTANRLARMILQASGEGSEPVVLMMEKSAVLIAAILAVLKAGKIVTPVEPAHARVGRDGILADSQAKLIVTNTRNLRLAVESSQSDARIVNVDEDSHALSSDNLCLPLSAETWAYLIYTSGSTGERKGVVKTGRNILHNIRAYTNDLHLTPEDRLSLIHSCSFSTSIRNTFGALLNGAALFPLDLQENALSYLCRWVNGEAITILHSTASLFRRVAGAVPDDQEFPSVRVLYLSSEAATGQEVEFFRARFPPECILISGMGCTESHLVCRYFMDKQTSLVDGIVPIGYPLDGVELFLLDESGDRIEGESTGEIAVRSPSNSPGYWRRPDLTAAAFDPDPDHPGVSLYRTGDLGRRLADGCFLHLGRKNSQVKIAGRWATPVAIERVLLAHPLIREAAVITQTSQGSEPRLIAYFVPSEHPGPAIRELRQTLVERLGEHMVPSQFVTLDCLPSNASGKVDRAALPVPSAARPALETPFSPPHSPIESSLAGIWRRILEMDSLGVDDDFLELGGSSLQATQAASEIFRLFGVELPLAIFWAKPTIRELALFIVESRTTLLAEEEIEQLLLEVEGSAGEASR